MPLIDSVIEVTVKGIKDNHLLLDESDGTRYRFDPGRETFIVNETLNVRVTGMDKSMVLGEQDQLVGVVVSSELKPESVLGKPVEIKETGEWDPSREYGPTAAGELFPKHAGKKFKRLTFSFTEELGEDDVKEINRASDLLQQGNHGEAMEIIGDALAKFPWLVDLYHVMGAIHASHKDLLTARKYFEMGCKTSDLSLKDHEDFVLDHREPANAFYQSHLHSLADVFMELGLKEQAVDAYERCYMLTPQDPGGVRLALQQLTGETYPCTDERLIRLPVDPYHHYFKYSDMPIRDGYDPDSRPDYEQWQRWEDSYRRLLILLCHQHWFAHNNMKPEEIDVHISLHDILESSLAQNSPPGIRMQFARKMAEVGNRHETVHFIGNILLQNLAQMQKEMQEQNPQQAPQQ